MRAICQICQDRLKSDLACGPCGHTFHHECLTRWLNHSASCPICRSTCCRGQVLRLYIETMSLTEDDAANMTVEDLQTDLECCRHKVQDNEKELEKRDETIETLHEEITTWQVCYESTCSRLREEQSVTSTLRRQISDMDKEIAKKQRIETECKVLTERLSLLETVETVVRSSKEEVAEMMHQYQGDSSPAACNKLATCLTMLKNEYELLKTKKKDALDQRDSLQKELYQQRAHSYQVEMQLKVCQGRLTDAENDISQLDTERESLQKKVRSLEKALVSPGSKSKLTRILESPLPERAARISLPGSDDSDRDVKVVLETPDRKRGALSHRKASTCEDQTCNGYAENTPPSSITVKKVKVEPESHQHSIGNDFVQPSNLQVQKKISTQDPHSKFVRKGYNGLGGHSTFRLPQKSKNVLKPKPINSSKYKGLSRKPPPLPSLSVPTSSSGYIELD